MVAAAGRAVRSSLSVADEPARPRGVAGAAAGRQVVVVAHGVEKVSQTDVHGVRGDVEGHDDVAVALADARG